VGNTVAVIVAAGRGSRMGTAVRKPYLYLGGKTVLARTISVFESCRVIDGYYVVIRAGDDMLFQQRVAPDGPFVKLMGLVNGGSTRRESVLSGLRRLDADSTEYVVIHDAVRPFVTTDLVEQVLSRARRHGAAVCGVPVTDTVKEVEDGFVMRTLERQSLLAVQTPQAFAYPVIMRAHRHADKAQASVTDDAQLVEALGHRVAVVEGDPQNTKLTTQDDLEAMRNRVDPSSTTPRQVPKPKQEPGFLARAAEVPTLRIRVGHGYDVHAFGRRRPLVLGGVRVPHGVGLEGHSDADVVTHAVCDALLGAAGQDDIGRHFPSSDERYRNVDSLELLRSSVAIIRSAGWMPLQVDVTVIAQTPRLAPHLEGMEQALASNMGIEPGRLNVKATTTDGLGFVGRKEGIAAQAIALVGLINPQSSS